jgi:hypothetical protein
MKYLLMFLLVFTGCSQMDATYGAAKDIYTVGKVVAPVVPMDSATRVELISIDAVATEYDVVRTNVREQQEEVKK